MSYFIRPGKKPGSGFKQSAVTWRIVWTTIQTLVGIALMGALVAGALMYFGLPWTWVTLFLGLWVGLPIAGWYYSADLVKRLTRATLPNPYNPDHARLIRIVNKLFPKTG
ncbi:MAG: hypothetical protein HY711_06670, partial [Candidatus Melainabacteria bacterium]|nr:hypothetical protein [Candidatus Melainabacteria bacterium]